MRTRYLRIATTASVAAAQEHYGSATQWARMGARGHADNTAQSQSLGPPELAFIAARDGFYLASVSETGWPYVQYRGGPTGFLAAVDASTLGFADFRGNRQYITTGNVQRNTRRKTPSFTMAAEWRYADTGVGAAIACGSQKWNGNCALLVSAPATISSSAGT